MPINPSSIVNTEFMVALRKKEDAYFQVPVDVSVQNVLAQMLRTTLDELGDSSGWLPFDCAEQYQSTESLMCPIDDPMLAKIRDLMASENLPVEASALDKPSQIDYYFARFRDAHNNECVGVRKAGQFKGTVDKSLLYFFDGHLTMVKGNIFRLDLDFDFLVFQDYVAIYKPRPFELIAGIEDELTKAIPNHIQVLSASVQFLNFEFASELAAKSVRARRLITAIKSRPDLAAISSDMFHTACQANGISVVQADGKWAPEPTHEIPFLEMLDRRRYHDPLVEKDGDLFRAMARSKVQ